MKKTILSAIAIVLISLSATAQIKKAAKAEQPKPSNDSLVIKGFYKNDTAKVVTVLMVEDGSLLWSKGYVIRRSLVSNGSSISVGEQLFSQKFEAIKPKDVYDVKALNWE